MFCYGGKIFIHDQTGEVYEIGTNPLSLLPSTISYLQPGNAGDAASSPECCNGNSSISARSLPEIETVINDETPANVDRIILDVNDETTSETKSY